MIYSREEYERDSRLLDQAIDLRKSLPQQVFQPQFSKFMFCEFDFAMSAEFWSLLQALSSPTAHDSVLVAVLQPDPTKYFYQEFRGYSFFTLPTSASSDAYWNTLQIGPDGSPADAPLYNSEIVVWLPKTLRWAIWGQRKIGICVAAFVGGEVSESTDQSKGIFLSEEVVTRFLESRFISKEIAETFLETLRLEYFNKK